MQTDAMPAPAVSSLLSHEFCVADIQIQAQMLDKALTIDIMKSGTACIASRCRTPQAVSSTAGSPTSLQANTRSTSAPSPAR